MAQQATLSAARRDTTGKGAARTLRREGKLPAVIYGHGREPEALTLDLIGFQKALAGRSASSTILELTVDGAAPVKAIIRDIQHDPVRMEQVLHVDFLEVHAGESVAVEVPVHLVGIADGVRNSGGVLDHALRTLELAVDPTLIPEYLEFDVTALTIGEHISAGQVVLPEGAELLTDPDAIVCTVLAPRVEEPTEAELAAAAAAAAEPEPELIRKPKGDDEAEDDEA